MKFDGASLAAPSLTKMKLYPLGKAVQFTANFFAGSLGLLDRIPAHAGFPL